jgi:hypothetical protein
VLTLFTIPKPFLGATATAQMNAMRSWAALGSGVEIVVCGDEPGAADAAAEVGARHLPDLARTELGTPLVSDAFVQVREAARTDLLAYANADMLLFPDLLAALRRTRPRPAVLIGRRVDLAVEGELAFDTRSNERLRAEAARVGRKGTERQIDYLVFPRAIDWQLPPFAVGRPGWDNWFLYRARSLGLAVIDASRVVLAVHQRHDHEHVPGRSGESWQGPEAERNRELAAEMGHAYGVHDATHVLTDRFLLPALGPRHLKRRLRRQPFLGRGVRLAETLVRR